MIQTFNEKQSSALAIKGQVYILNKLAKEDRFRAINELVLSPLWQVVGDTYA